ncbi:hypothetical protein [Bacillus sp. REN16]|uniref:hypothetical protein n=1 Tax=Bacillus sp. REN16 TaxID=2887296 RepID=UPI001E6583DA|nr:hypothetical protein [Bacillus sp. REN16]MCC3357141.1 hypothetical protein [Bacillus sp. REN16]
MVKRSMGILLIAIATILIVVKYVSETFGSVRIWDSISNLSLLSFLVGLCFLSWGEYEVYKKGKSHPEK